MLCVACVWFVVVCCFCCAFVFCGSVHLTHYSSIDNFLYFSLLLLIFHLPSLGESCQILYVFQFAGLIFEGTFGRLYFVLI